MSLLETLPGPVLAKIMCSTDWASRYSLLRSSKGSSLVLELAGDRTYMRKTQTELIQHLNDACHNADARVQRIAKDILQPHRRGLLKDCVVTRELLGRLLTNQQSAAQLLPLCRCTFQRSMMDMILINPRAKGPSRFLRCEIRLQERRVLPSGQVMRYPAVLRSLDGCITIDQTPFVKGNEQITVVFWLGVPPDEPDDWEDAHLEVKDGWVTIRCPGWE